MYKLPLHVLLTMLDLECHNCEKEANELHNSSSGITTIQATKVAALLITAYTFRTKSLKQGEDYLKINEWITNL